MKINIVKIILIVLLILTCFQIFRFSNQNGTESKGISRKITIAITKNIKKIQELSESEKQVALDKTEKIVRKLAHFSIYTVVGILMMSLMSIYKIKEVNKVCISLIVGMLYACTDEIHQIFIPERTALITDVLIDTLGVGTGIILVILVSKLIKKMKK